MSTREIQELQEALRSARDEVLSAIDGISESEAHEIPAPGEWTVAQLLAHITELQTFWIARADRITKENDPQIARTAVENDQRIGAVTDHSGDNMTDLVREMDTANDQVVAVVGGIDPKNLDRPGHREDNPITAAGVIRYVAGHVRDHANQITESRRLIRERR